MDKRFDMIMEALSKKDMKFFDSRVKELELGIGKAKLHIKEFLKKKKKLEAYVKTHPNSVSEDDLADNDTEFLKLMSLYNNTIQELYSAKNSINISMIPNQSKFAEGANNASLVTGIISVIVALTGLIKSDTPASQFRALGGISGAVVSSIIGNLTDWGSFVIKWNKKLEEYKRSGTSNLNVLDAAKLLNEQIDDLIRDMENKYWFVSQ